MRAQLLATLLFATLVGAFVLGLRALGWLEPFELVVYDQFVRHAGPRPASPSRVLLVEVSEQDIQRLGHWPISDATLAAVLRTLADAGASAIGVDIYRDLPVPPGEEDLAQLLVEERRIVAVHKLADVGAEAIPGPPALAGSDRVGFIDLLPDRDGSVRRGLLFMNADDGEVEYSFALRVALDALAAEGIRPTPHPEQPEWLALGPATLRPLESTDGGYVDLDAGGYQFLLDFAASRSGFESVGFGAVLRGEVDRDRIRGRTVLVGVDAESLPDFFRVPIRAGQGYQDGIGIAGVQLHAHVVDQLLRFGLGEARPIRVASERSEVLLVALCALLGCAAALAGRGGATVGALGTLAAVLAGVALLWLAGAMSYRFGVWVPVAAPGLAWVGAMGLVTAWRSSRERAQREVLMNLFSRYLSPQIADEIWRQRADFFHNGRPRPQRLVATMLFADIRGYTARAEKMDPEQLLEWINDVMGRMADSVERAGGVVDDYFGDGLFALFGVPFARGSEAMRDADARSAVACAVEMARTLDLLNASYRKRGFPQVQLRIGIHTGAVVAGSVGSAKRLKYTAMGDAVVTSKRLESLDGVEHAFERAACRILISEATERRLDGSFEREALGAHPLKGKHEEVAVYRVIP